jgi:Uma2 family endonuclease
VVIKSRTTLEEYLALPDVKPYVELMDGEVFEKPMANRRHGRIVAYLIHLLQTYLDRTQEADVETEVRHHETDDDWVFLPDVSVTLRSRTMANPQMEGLVTVLPDLAIEVLSPDDRPGRLHRRIEHYMRSGVPLLWVVDPDEERVTIWRPGQPMSSASAPEKLSAEPVLQSFELDLEAMFARGRS